MNVTIASPRDYEKGELLDDHEFGDTGANPGFYTVKSVTVNGDAVTIEFIGGESWTRFSQGEDDDGFESLKTIAIGDVLCISNNDGMLELNRAVLKLVTVTVQQHGENLYYNTATDTYWAGAAEIKTIKGLSSVIINGSVKNTSASYICKNLPIKAGTYTIRAYGLNVITATTDRLYVHHRKEGGAASLIASNITDNKAVTFVVPEDGFLDVSMVGDEGSIYENKEIFIHIEAGESKELITYTSDENGNVNGVISNGKSMTLIAENGATITVEYNKDINKVIEDINNKLSVLSAAVVNNE